MFVIDVYFNELELIVKQKLNNKFNIQVIELNILGVGGNYKKTEEMYNALKFDLRVDKNKMKVIYLIVLINALCYAFCFGQQTDTIYTIAEIMPSFQYDTCTSEKSSLKNYFMDNYKMPAILTDNGYSGRIIVEFVVERDSSISNFKVIRGIDKALDISVIETIKKMPKWNPGINKGKTVRTKFLLPVSIRWLYGKY